MPSTNQKGSLRIIGGKWKRHLIHFAGPADLRPTSDAIRETLFNWLTPVIQGATCLDLFSGSGALGFEAASRGAHRVHLVDDNHVAFKQLLRTQEDLCAEQVHIHYKDALKFLEMCGHRFNIVFLDPPFQTCLSEEVCSILENSNILLDQGLVYLERPKKGSSDFLSRSWEMYKENATGSIIYGLYKLNKKLKAAS